MFFSQLLTHALPSRIEQGSVHLAIWSGKVDEFEKTHCLSLDRGAAMALLEQLLESPPPDMRAALAAWAAEKGVAMA